MISYIESFNAYSRRSDPRNLFLVNVFKNKINCFSIFDYNSLGITARIIRYLLCLYCTSSPQGQSVRYIPVSVANAIFSFPFFSGFILLVWTLFSVFLVRCQQVIFQTTVLFTYYNFFLSLILACNWLYFLLSSALIAWINWLNNYHYHRTVSEVTSLNNYHRNVLEVNWLNNYRYHCRVFEVNWFNNYNCHRTVSEVNSLNNYHRNVLKVNWLNNYHYHRTVFEVNWLNNYHYHRTVSEVAKDINQFTRYIIRNRGSSVSIVSDYGLDDRVIQVRSSAEAKEDFSSSSCVQTGSGAHPASCPMGTGCPLPGGKARPGVTLTTHLI
jgi:hypothetical protein